MRHSYWVCAQAQGFLPVSRAERKYRDKSFPLTARRPLSARPPAGHLNEEGDSRSWTRWFHRSEPRRISHSEALQTLHPHRLPRKGVPRGNPPGRIFTRPQAGACEANRRSRRLLGRVWSLFARAKSDPGSGAGQAPIASPRRSAEQLQTD